MDRGAWQAAVHAFASDPWHQVEVEEGQGACLCDKAEPGKGREG